MKLDVIEDIRTYLPKYTVFSNLNLVKPSATPAQSSIVKSFQIPDFITNIQVFENNTKLIDDFDEEWLEKLLNFDDESSFTGYAFTSGFRNIRIYKRRVITELKSRYKGTCQICGFGFKIGEYEVDITEAHHIEYFSKSLNNKTTNLIILCPNHHTLIHRTNPIYDRQKKLFIMPNGKELEISYNLHL